MSTAPGRSFDRLFRRRWTLRQMQALLAAVAMAAGPALPAQDEQPAEGEGDAPPPPGLLTGTGAKPSTPAKRGEAGTGTTTVGNRLQVEPPPAASTAPAQGGDDEEEVTRNAAGEPIIDLIFPDTRIENVVDYINQNQPVKVMLFGKTAGERVGVVASGLTLEEALGAITRPKSWVYWKLDGDQGYGIADRAYFESEVLPRAFIQKVFQPKNLKASELQKAITELLTKGAANGSAIADDRTNKLIVNDLPVVIERIERLLREIDIQLITRVFRIRHANVEDLAKKLEQYKSGPGTIELDPKTHLIIVTDLLANIKRMELLIDILDVGPEIVIYDVNNIGIDGKDLESLKTIIDSIRTEDLLFEVNAKQGVFILEDIPSVHERVEQILQSFDRPVKQVQIQGEIVQTSFDRTFNYGVDRFMYSGDMVDAVRSQLVNPPAGVISQDLASETLGFRDIGETFPAYDLTGGTISGAFLNKNVYLQASAVFTDTSTNILLQPNLLVKNQEASRLFIGAETPFLTTFFNDNQTGGTTRSTTQQRIQDGLDFEITPSIANSYLIELDIKINNDKAFNAGENEGITLIGRNRQNIETVLQIPSGQTRVIGGLISNTLVEGSSGVPFLSKLPILGGLFGKKTNSDGRDNLMLFITPTVVEDEVPRSTGTNGRRGRLVSEYEDIRDDTNLSPEARQRIAEELDQLNQQSMDESSLLSSDETEELTAIELLREKLSSEAQGGTLNPFEHSNYTPAASTSTGTSINTSGTGAQAGGQGQGGGRGQQGQPGAGNQPGQRLPGQGQPGNRRRRPGGQGGQGGQGGAQQQGGQNQAETKPAEVPPDLRESTGKP